MVQISPPASYMFPEQSWRYSEAFCFAKCKMPFACADWFVYFAASDPTALSGGSFADSGSLSFEPNPLPRH
jgi:hypothetical protein